MFLRSAGCEIRQLKTTKASGSSRYWKTRRISSPMSFVARRRQGQHLTEYEHGLDGRAPQRASRSRSKAVDRETLLAGHEPSTSTKIFPSLTSYFARSSASAFESTLMAACGWRALIARIALPLSGMATRHHSCSGEPPPGFGSTVTIFHPVVMRRRLTSSLVPAHPTASTRRPNQFTATSLPGRVPRDHRAGRWRRELAKTALQ